MSAFRSSTPALNSAASPGPTRLRSLRSPPAKKVFFAEVMMTPLTPSFSDSSRFTTSLKDAMKSAFIVLADWFGSSRTRLTMPSASCS